MPIVKEEGIQAAIKEWRVRASNERRRFVSQRRFIEDHVPGVVSDLDDCERHFRVYQSCDRPGIYKVTAHRCQQVPWCIPCVQHQEWKRAQSALRAIQRCTPCGQKPRFIHVVQTAPVLRDNTGWGMEASRDLKRFRKLVWSVLEENLEGGLGAIMTYQDFGEEAFVKRHPHIDFTINGWMLQDGQPAKTTFELRGGGRKRWDDSYEARAANLGFVGNGETGDVQFPKRIAEGVGNYYKALAYQVREMIDIRKLEYDRHKQVVYWHDYKRARRTKFTVLDFKAGLAEYQYRLRQWPQGEDKGMELTTRHGHLSDRLIRKTQIAMGGKDPWEGTEEWERGYAVG